MVSVLSDGGKGEYKLVNDRVQARCQAAPETLGYALFSFSSSL